MNRKLHLIPLFSINSDRWRKPIYNVVGVTSGLAVLGIRFDKGVMMATDTLVSYGSEKAFQESQRMFKMNENIVFGGSGDYADFIIAKTHIETMIIQDFCFGQPNLLKPSMLTHWLSTELYNRRVAGQPLSFDSVVGGIQHDGTPYLATITRYGGFYADFVAATGPARMGIPMICYRKPNDREFTAMEAAKLIEDVMAVVFYRHTSALESYLVGICKRGKCSVEGPFKIRNHWEFAATISGY
nr:proteasome subunit beta type-4-like [Drosophila kikkawai]